MDDFAHLVMVTSSNNNKYYDMCANGDILDVTYGRIGSTAIKARYPISQWNKKYNEKIRTGYVDMTHLVSEPQVADTGDDYLPIADSAIAEVFDFLRRCSRQILQQNYTISTDKVTMAMVREAQYKLEELGHARDCRDFNRLLIELFSVLPRQMGQVQNYLAGSANDMGKIVQREQDLLDVMRGQVAIPVAKKTNENSAAQTMLEAMNLLVSPVSAEEKENIIRHLGQQGSKYHNAWRVDQADTRKQFKEYMESHPGCVKKFLWHGSKNENWLNILGTGLKLNPNATITGKMFGKGIYFAPSATKSAGYTSMTGSYWANGRSNRAFMAVMEVACGKAFDIYDRPYNWSGITAQNLDSYCKGANYVFAHKDKGMLRNDEIVVYNEAQVTVRYLVELRV